MDCLLAVGLGNVGAEYASTRHNVGFMVLDALARSTQAVFRTDRYADVAEAKVRGKRIFMVKPSTYMNLSGNAVRYWLDKLGWDVERLLVVSDDLHLPFGAVRMRMRGSSGGHNGLSHIVQVLGTDQWMRIRMGIGSDFPQGGQIDYVLQPFPAEQAAQLPALCARVAQGIQDVVLMGAERAMDRLNVRRLQEG